MNAALIGYGYWGINIAKALQDSPYFNLACIFDTDMNRLKCAKKSHKDIQTFNCIKDILSSNIEAVFIATPPNTHFEIAKNALLSDKHIFVEKPFTTNAQDAHTLLEIAKRKDKIAICDHLFVFAEPILYIKENLSKFGDIAYINSRRINLGLFQHASASLWDLAVHDLSIVEFLFGLEITKVSAYTKKYKDFPNDLVNIGLELQNGIAVNIYISWLSPIKIREMIIGGSQMSAFYDDTKKDKLSLCQAGVVLEKEFTKDELFRQMKQKSYGKFYTPKLQNTKSLNSSIDNFYKCIQSNNQDKERKSILSIIKALELITKAQC